MSLAHSARKKESQAAPPRRSQVADAALTAQEQSVKQQDQITRMTNENEQLKKEISAVSGTHYDYVKADKLAVLQGDVDALERRYQFERMRKNDLTKRYQLARIDVLQSRKVKGGVNVEKEQAAAVQHQVEILESRLDQALGQFNDALSYNKELRDRIDTIREERRVFQRVHKRMEDDLKEKKRAMADYMERSNLDMDDRDAQEREVARVRAALEEQQETYKAQLRDLDAAMFDIRTMREEQTEMQLELEAREYEFGERANDANAARALEESRLVPGAGASVMGDDGASVAGSDGGDESANALRVEKESASITSILHQIKEALGTDDLEELRTQYLHSGDRNFSLYKYVNELSARKEGHKDTIRDLQRLLSEEDDSEKKHQALIARLESQLAGTEEQLDAMATASAQLRNGAAQLAATAEDVYVHIGCTESSGRPPGAEEKCSEGNMREFFGAIEERATQILIAAQRHQQSGSHTRRIANVQRSRQNSQSPRMDMGGSVKEGMEEPVAKDAAEDEPVPHDDAPVELAPDASAMSLNVTAAAGEVPDGHPGGSMALTELGDAAEEAPPVLPMAPQTAHSAVSARNLVRMMDLPSASIGGGTAEKDQDDDRIVSHEEIRRQVEARMASTRERDDRNQQRKRKDPVRESPQKQGGASTQPKAAIVGTGIS